AASWALEGAALLWVGCRQSRLLPRLAGLALQFAAATHFLRDADVLFTGLPILNSTCLGALIIAGASLFGARLLNTYRDRLTPYEGVFASVLFFWALLWWAIAGVGEIDRRIASMYKLHSFLAFFGATSLFCSEVARRLKILVARWPALWLLPLMAVFVAFEWIDHIQPFVRYGWLAWPLAWVVFYLTLRRHEDETDRNSVGILHVGGAWLAVIFLSRECAWLIDHVVAGAGSWPAIAWAIVPATGLLLMPTLKRFGWPVGKHVTAYGVVVCGGFAAYLLGWSLFTSVTRNGDPYPLPYVPVLNPLDIAQMYVLLAGIAWLRQTSAVTSTVPPKARWSAFGVITFIWLNAVLLRTIHYYAGVPYVPHLLWGSTLVQAALSIFWTTLALATTVIATKRGHRFLWLIGAALLVAVVAKLIFVDLSRVGSLERIVSFIGVGLLMLVIGYFAPIPPRQKEQT
ncbi:MAG TPA: DUF2339 domain-containing protein, partial [Steroidobacteraceae bacterium]|nr:DUF2339 domain-containing protein [Steroidobacteraceae bacterium]